MSVRGLWLTNMFLFLQGTQRVLTLRQPPAIAPRHWGATGSSFSQVPVVADLKGVGENLMEHVYPGGVSATVNEQLDIDVTPFAGPLMYYIQNKGPWTIPGGVETVAFLQTKLANKSLDLPDVEIVLFSMSPASEEGERFMTDIGLVSEVDQQWPYRKPSVAKGWPHVSK